MTNSAKSTCPNCGSQIDEEAPEGLCPKCVLAGAVTPSESSSPKGISPPPTVDEIAAEFPQLEILELIGVGGMGAVYKANQPNLNRDVALKVLSKDLAENPSFVERFNREARMLASLNHPNIVTIYDFGSSGPLLYIMMEFIDGANLRQAMKIGVLTPPDTLGLVQEVCSALQFAHDEGILHRDIKPENILIDEKGRVKIADFGIAKLINQEGDKDFTLTEEGSILGSLHYMAPERIESPGEVDERSDIYSLGVVFYELLTGELPIGKFALPSEKTPVDSSFDEVVMRSLEKERQLRYQSATEVKDSVEAITQTHPTQKGETKNSQTTIAHVGNRSVAKRATASAVLTAISLILPVFALLPVIYLLTGERGNKAGISFGHMIIALIFLLLAGTPALLGLIFGAQSLTDIRESKNTKSGLGRAMFGTLTWPLLTVILLTSIGTAMGFTALFGPGMLWFLCAIAITVVVGTFVILSVWRWVKGIPRGTRSHDLPDSAHAMGPIILISAIIVLLPTLLVLVPWGMFTLTPEKIRNERPQAELQNAKPDGEDVGPVQPPMTGDLVNWRLEQPEVELNLTVAPMHVATITVLHTDDSGKKTIMPEHKYSIVASDVQPFHGKIQVGSLASKDRHGNPIWDINLIKKAETIRFSDGSKAKLDAYSSGGTRKHSLSGDWLVVPNLPSELDFTDKDRHDLVIGSPRDSAKADEDPLGTLSLQIITQHRSGPGVPDKTIDYSLIGKGTIDWIYLLKSYQ